MPDISQILVAKAARVADAGMRRRVPSTRADLLDCAAVIRSRIRHGHDPLLKSLGFSLTGVAHFYVEEFGLTDEAADILAAATIQLVESYRQ